MKKYFPSQNGSYRYLQTNRSDMLGNLWSTFNLDFQSNLGAVRLSPKMIINTGTSDDADLGLPTAFQYAFGVNWAVCGSKVFRTPDSLPTSSFAEDGSFFSVGLSNSQFDITNPAGTTMRYTYDGNGTNPNISSATFPVGSTVTLANTGFAAANTGTFTVTGSGTNYFEVSNGSGVVESNKQKGAGTIVVSGTGAPTLVFSAQYSDLKYFNGSLWATTGTGLYRKFGTSDAWELMYVFSSPTLHKLVYLKNFNRLYFRSSNRQIGSIDANDVVSNTAGSDYVINLSLSSGLITTFDATDQRIYIGVSVINDTSGGFSPGTILDWDGISEQATNEYLLDAAGCVGIVYDQNVVYAVDTEARVLRLNYTFSEIARLPVSRILLTQATTDPVSLTTGRFIHHNGLAPTKNGTLLFLINNLNDDVQSDVSENTSSGIWELDLSSNSLTHRQSLTYQRKDSVTISDFGQNRIASVGALEMCYLGTNGSLGRSTMLVGASYYTDATNVSSGIFIDSPASPAVDKQGEKRGYLVTTFFQADDIADEWNKLWATYKRFKSSSDRMDFKYRLEEDVPTYATITWVNTTTFTTTTNPSAYWTAGTGGEVEVIQGTGSGACAHITNVSGSGTYTVTLDQAVNGVTTGTAKARFQKWIKTTPDIEGILNSYKKYPINATNTQIQIKCCMTFFSDSEFHKFVLTSTNKVAPFA